MMIGSHGQTTDTEETDYLHLCPATHLESPQLRQRKAQQDQIRQHVHTVEEISHLTTIDALRFNSLVPSALHRSARKDQCDLRDCGVGCYEETDGPEDTPQLLKRKDTSE